MSTGLDRNSHHLQSFTIKVTMCKYIVVPLSLCSIFFVLMDCTSSFDQRQTGSFNVQVGLKNIQLIALIKGGKEEYVDYDYAYDYSEMTIKPQGGTTLKPSNVTNTPTASNITTPSPIEQAINSTTAENSTSPTAQHLNISEDNNNSTANVNIAEFTINDTVNATEKIINDTVNMEYSNHSLDTTTINVTTDVSTTITSSAPNNISTTETTTKTNCKRGFVQNHQGKCEYKVHGTTNALRRIVKLAQRIKIGREYTET